MKHSCLRTLLVLLCLALLGCSQPEIKEVTSDSTVVAFGDSLTSGYGVSDEESYPSILADLLGCDVVNSGVSGEDTTAGLRRLPETLEAYQPELVVLCFGGNDMLRKHPEARTIANLKAMIELIHASGADIVMIGVPRPGLLLAVPGFYETLADEYALPFDDSLLKHILSKNALKSDHIHPNEAGYQLMAERIHALIKKSER
jgi:lysophospholipase L1-like esterase